MAEYKVVDAEQLDADLTEIADEVRILTDISDTMTIDEITSNIVQANADVETQTDLLAQIKTALEGKAAGDGYEGILLSDFTGSNGYAKIAHISFKSEELKNLNVRTNLTNIERVYFLFGAEELNSGIFDNCKKITAVYGDFSNLIKIGASAFNTMTALTEIPKMPKIQEIGKWAFGSCYAMTEFRFYTKPTTINNQAFEASGITNIYCPWAEGEIANAPWGAKNATIHYNITYDENDNPII